MVFDHFEKYESQWEGLFYILILWKIQHVPNHQPGYLFYFCNLPKGTIREIVAFQCVTMLLQKEI